MAPTREDQIVFGFVPADANPASMPMLMLGIPRAAWVYMKDGKTHMLDLSSIGIPIQLMLYGGPDHAACVKMIEEAARIADVPLEDHRRKDFSIRAPSDPPPDKKS